MRPGRAGALALALVAAACSGPPPAARPDPVALDWTLSPDPAVVGMATLVLTLNDDGQPVRGARVRVEADMAHPGMRPELADATELDPGRYKARLRFSMAGDWLLTLEAEWGAGRRCERLISLRVSPAG